MLRCSSKYPTLLFFLVLLLNMSKPITSFFTSTSVKRKASDSGALNAVPDKSKSSRPSPGRGNNIPPGIVPGHKSGTSAPISGDGSNALLMLGNKDKPSSISALETSSWMAAFNNMEPSWKEALEPEFKRPYFVRLINFLESEERSGKKIFPPKGSILSAFQLCPLSEVKVVVVGQDPYHGPGQANGLAFSVGKGVAIPPSLKNIIKEASQDVALTPCVSASPGHGCLEKWASQGVLMLNTCLTVRRAEANSHQKKGWEEFTDAIVRELKKKNNIVYLLWGKPASTKVGNIDLKNNTVISASHPSPLGAYKTDKPFMGSKCFSRCNTALKAYQKEQIDFNL